MSLNPKSTLIRTLSGILYIALIVGCIVLGGVLGTAALALLLSGFSASEYLKLVKSAPWNRTSIAILDIFLIMSSTLIFIIPQIIALCLVLILVRLAVEVFNPEEDPVADVSKSLMGIVYIGIPFACMVWLSTDFAKPISILPVFIFVWLNDTGAFLVGSLVGRHKMIERVSPKKTWEGLLGGIIITLGCAAFMCAQWSGVFGLPRNIVLWISMAFAVTVAATIGDLFESMLKRRQNIKDSGHLIPGHGGILDRVDSLLFAFPAATAIWMLL